jgi:DNA-binding NtrC family response regulator
MARKPSKNKVIWITEDDPSLGEAMDLGFSVQGYTTRYFSDPYRLMEELSTTSTRPDIIITDYSFSPTITHMAAMRGDDMHTDAPHAAEDLLDKLSKLHLRIPVILFTGREPEDVQKLCRHGKHDITYVQKPHVATLNKLVHEKLESRGKHH